MVEVRTKFILDSPRQFMEEVDRVPFVCAYGQQFEDAGFVFSRAGTRKGGEIAWSISKAIGQ